MTATALAAPVRGRTFACKVDEVAIGQPRIELTEAQRAAVEWGDGPLMVLAGAGTGKTTVVVERVRHLLATLQARSRAHAVAVGFRRGLIA